jgi:uncharacterized DUF497 family protein
MDRFVWDEGKNRLLKDSRGVTFEMVVQAIQDGRLLDILEHPNKERYGNQRLYVVELDNYAWIVPCEYGEASILLKTIFPSRRYTRLYLTEEE